MRSKEEIEDELAMRQRSLERIGEHGELISIAQEEAQIEALEWVLQGDDKEGEEVVRMELADG